jgi:hypothetical protein
MLITHVKRKVRNIGIVEGRKEANPAELQGDKVQPF